MTVLWRGLDAPRLEIARVERAGRELRASGTQIGIAYELRYELEPERLRVEVVGEGRRELTLDGADFFDLGYSPLFNSLPVARDRLLGSRTPRDYLMLWVDVPTLETSESQQRYEPVDRWRIRFRSGGFNVLMEFGPDELVERYEGLAERLR